MFHIYTSTLNKVESAEVNVFPPGKICKTWRSFDVHFILNIRSVMFSPPTKTTVKLNSSLLKLWPYFLF